MYGYIYETTCIPTGKKYIGMHKWSKDTIDESYIGSGTILQKAIKKYGRTNFTCKILEWCETRDKLSEREKEYISLMKAPINKDYYNVNDGGFGGHSEFYVQPTSNAQLTALECGRHLPASETLKKKLSAYRKNVVVSDRTKRKLRENQLGKRVITDGTINKYVTNQELKSYLDNGWSLGFSNDIRNKKAKTLCETSKNRGDSWKQNLSLAFKGRRWVNNGVSQKQVKQEEVATYISNGYSLGRIK